MIYKANVQILQWKPMTKGDQSLTAQTPDLQNVTTITTNSCVKVSGIR